MSYGMSDVLLEQMSTLMSQQRWTEALQKGQTLLGMIPSDDRAKRAVILYNLGTIYNELKQFDEAEKQYKEAVRGSPHDADVWYNRANNQHQWAETARRSGDMAGHKTHIHYAMLYALEAQRNNPTDSDIARLIELIRRSM